MANKVGLSALLNDQQGNLYQGRSVQLLAVAITSALTGSLTIKGLTTGNSTPNMPADWVLSPGSVGAYTHPGNGVSGGALLAYSLSDPTDVGKVVIAFA